MNQPNKRNGHDDADDITSTSGSDADASGEGNELTRTGGHKQRRSYSSRAKQAWSRTTISNKLVVVLTAIIALSNFFYVFYARRQWKVMSGQLAEMAKEYPEQQKSAAAAASAATTAKNTLDSSARSFKQEERAYLWASSFNMSDPVLCPDSRGIHVCGDVHVVNSGRTPANGVRIWRYATFGPNAERTIKAIKVPVYAAPSGDMLGTTGDKWGTAFTGVVDSETAQHLSDGTIQLYIYGVVQYFDIFGKYHETGFCSDRVYKTNLFISCGFGNWFDERSTNKARK